MPTGQEITMSSGEMVKVYTDQPNPYGNEWSAVDDSYDADWQGEETGYVSSSPHGWGKTEAEAIADLIQQIEERHETR